MRQAVLHRGERRPTEVAEPRARAARARRPAAGRDPRPARPAGGHPGQGRRRSATARWAWRWSRSAGSWRSFPQLVREVAAGDRQGRAAACSRARTSSSTPASWTASPTRSSTWSPTPSTTAARRPAERAAAGKHGPAVVRVVGPRRRRDRRHRGRRRRRRHRRGRAARGRGRGRRCCPRTRTATGQALLSVLFLPGFSTRDDVTETSGRGVGLDVVRTAVEDLGGDDRGRQRAGRRHPLRR